MHRNIVPRETMRTFLTRSRLIYQGLAVAGAALAAVVLALAPAWMALALAIAAAAAWCRWIERTESKQLARPASGPREPARILDGMRRFGHPQGVPGIYPGQAGIRADQPAASAQRL